MSRMRVWHPFMEQERIKTERENDSECSCAQSKDKNGVGTKSFTKQTDRNLTRDVDARGLKARHYNKGRCWMHPDKDEFSLRLLLCVTEV